MLSEFGLLLIAVYAGIWVNVLLLLSSSSKGLRNSVEWNGLFVDCSSCFRREGDWYTNFCVNNSDLPELLLLFNSCRESEDRDE